jgi:hypothetical protein
VERLDGDFIDRVDPLALILGLAILFSLVDNCFRALSRQFKFSWMIGLTSRAGISFHPGIIERACHGDIQIPDCGH